MLSLLTFIILDEASTIMPSSTSDGMLNNTKIVTWQSNNTVIILSLNLNYLPCILFFPYTNATNDIEDEDGQDVDGSGAEDGSDDFINSINPRISPR